MRYHSNDETGNQGGLVNFLYAPIFEEIIHIPFMKFSKETGYQYADIESIDDNLCSKVAVT